MGKACIHSSWLPDCVVCDMIQPTSSFCCLEIPTMMDRMHDLCSIAIGISLSFNLLSMWVFFMFFVPAFIFLHSLRKLNIFMTVLVLC